MSKSLREIAQELRDSNKKVQLIYAFNGVGKTRLSREFRELIAPKGSVDEVDTTTDLGGIKIIYYNAFTEDLFYWDNDLEGDSERKLKIQPNGFTRWILKEQGQDSNIIDNFQHYTSQFLTPKFSPDFSQVTFSIERGNDESFNNIKISKGEESNFIWCVFYSLLEEVVEVLNVAEPADRETGQFDHLEYIFIDDPVSSLDENHLIELAVHIAKLIKYSQSDLKFIIATHNPLFYNILHNELNNKESQYDYKPKHFEKYRLEKLDNGTFLLKNQSNDSPFSYHLYLMSLLEEAVNTGEIHKFHFNFLRNILEKTSTFLGYKKWGDLLPQSDDGLPNPYESRLINLSSHSKYSGEEVIDIKEDDKRVLGFLLRKINEMYRFKTNANK